MAIRAAILTASDKGAAGERVDTAGPAVARLLEGQGIEVVASALVADERDVIAEQLSAWADSNAIDLVLTTGGTGLSDRDVTPEATLDVVEKLVPGLGEVMREFGRQKTPLAALSRSVAGVRGRTLIINLPGSERGARESLEAVINLIPHAVQLLRGDTAHGGA